MAVTDMTESLPWWARGAAPQGQGPVAPQGANQQAWLDYLSSMFGVGAAQAGENDPIATLNEALKNRQPGPPAADNTIPPTLPPGPQGPPGYLGSTGATPPLTPGGDPRGPDVAMNQITGMGGGATNPGFAPPGITPGRVNPNVPTPAAQPVSAAAPVSGPMANNSRFVGVDRPNADPQSSMRSGPQGTALNLAGLFGGGQPLAVNPNAPSAAATPMSGGPLAIGGGMSKAPGSMGPLQKGMQWPSSMGPFKPKKGDARARILAPDLYG